MTNRHLTYYLISLAITLAISNNLMSKGKDFLSYFEQTSEEKFMQGSVEQRDSRFRIPKKTVDRYIRIVKNDNIFNLKNGEPIEYFALYKVQKDNYWLISYYSSDRFERKTFISVYSKQEGRITKELLVEDYVGDIPMVSFSIEKPQKETNIEKYNLYVEDHRSGCEAEPFTVPRLDLYLLDSNLSYIETYYSRDFKEEIVNFNNDSTFTRFYQLHKVIDPFLDYFVTGDTIPSLESAFYTSIPIPMVHLRKLFPTDPTRGVEFEFYGSRKIKTQQGWILFYIKMDGPHAEAYLCNYTEKTGAESYLHIFSGHGYDDLIPFTIGYQTKGNTITITYFIEENKRHRKEIKRQSFRLDKF